jgi:hypothetical protein
MPFPDPLTLGSLLILAANQAPTCTIPAPARINVTPKTAEVKIDSSRNMESIAQEQVDTINPYGYDKVSHTSAFMHGELKMMPRIDVEYKYIPEYSAVCLWYKSVDIIIEIDPSIVIAKEVYADPCMRKHVLGHEMKHVKVDRQIVNKYAQIMGKKVFDGLQARGFVAGPIKGEHGQATMDRMHQTVKQIVELEYRKMSIERQELQQGVDSLDEYESVSAACPDFRPPAFLQKSPAAKH